MGYAQAIAPQNLRSNAGTSSLTIKTYSAVGLSTLAPDTLALLVWSVVPTSLSGAILGDADSAHIDKGKPSELLEIN